MRRGRPSSQKETNTNTLKKLFKLTNPKHEDHAHLFLPGNHNKGSGPAPRSHPLLLNLPWWPAPALANYGTTVSFRTVAPLTKLASPNLNDDKTYILKRVVGPPTKEALLRTHWSHQRALAVRGTWRHLLANVRRCRRCFESELLPRGRSRVSLILG